MLLVVPLRAGLGRPTLYPIYIKILIFFLSFTFSKKKRLILFIFIRNHLKHIYKQSLTFLKLQKSPLLSYNTPPHAGADRYAMPCLNKTSPNCQSLPS